MISRNNLIGWLIFLRINGGSEESVPIAVPSEVSAALMKNGWVRLYEEEDGAFEITSGGKMISDIYAPEFGVDPIKAAL